MTAPVLYSIYFGNRSDQYPRLARVLEKTARANCPSWEVRVERVWDSKLRGPSGSQGRGDNAWKLDRWVAFVRGRADGDRVLLLDADTFVNAPLDPLWDVEFDLAYTARAPRFPFPLNGGVIALRVSAASRSFLDLWLRRDQQFFQDPAAHLPWRKRYGGMNQSSLGSLLETGSALRSWLRVEALPCREWNACDEDGWNAFGPQTRIVHVKSQLRMTIFGIGPSTARLVRLAKHWRDLEI